jgi:hypothetical protein
MAASSRAAAVPARRARLGVAIGIACLLAVAVAARGPSGADEDLAQPVLHSSAGAHAAAPSRATSQKGDVRQDRLAARLAQALSQPSTRADFPLLADAGHRAWEPTLAPPAAAPASSTGVVPATEAAPPVPFQWIGRWEQPAAASEPAPAPMVILSGPSNTWVVKQGDIIALDWKIVGIGADHIELLHLPTSTQRTLSLNPS